MGKTRYDNEFKSTIVELYNSGKKAQELSKEYSVSIPSINRWVKDSINLESGNLLKEDNARIKALEKELKDVRLERDILKKAVGIFSKSDR
jgi:transposase